MCALVCLMNSKRDVQGRIVHVNTDEDPSGWRPCFTFLETLEEKLKNEDVQGIICNVHSHNILIALTKAGG